MLTENSILSWYDQEVNLYNKSNADINDIYRELGHVKAIKEGLTEDLVERTVFRKDSKKESEDYLKRELDRILKFREKSRNAIVILRRVLQRPSLTFADDGTIMD